MSKYLFSLVAASLLAISPAMADAGPTNDITCAELLELDSVELPYIVSYLVGYLDAQGQIDFAEDDYYEIDDVPMGEIIDYCVAYPKQKVADVVKRKHGQDDVDHHDDHRD